MGFSVWFVGFTGNALLAELLIGDVALAIGLVLSLVAGLVLFMFCWLLLVILFRVCFWVSVGLVFWFVDSLHCWVSISLVGVLLVYVIALLINLGLRRLFWVVGCVLLVVWSGFVCRDLLLLCFLWVR